MVGFRVNHDDRIALLKGVSLFASCSREELRRISALTTLFEAKQGTLFARQGQPGKEFFVVISGSAVATRNDRELTRYGPGGFFGELALLDGGERTATVYAESDMRLLVLSAGEFKSLQLAAPSVAFKMLAELGARLRKADQLMDEFLDGETPVTLPDSWTL